MEIISRESEALIPPDALVSDVCVENFLSRTRFSTESFPNVCVNLVITTTVDIENWTRGRFLSQRNIFKSGLLRFFQAKLVCMSINIEIWKPKQSMGKPRTEWTAFVTYQVIYWKVCQMLLL